MTRNLFKKLTTTSLQLGLSPSPRSTDFSYKPNFGCTKYYFQFFYLKNFTKLTVD